MKWEYLPALILALIAASAEFRNWRAGQAKKKLEAEVESLKATTDKSNAETRKTDAESHEILLRAMNTASQALLARGEEWKRENEQLREEIAGLKVERRKWTEEREKWMEERALERVEHAREKAELQAALKTAATQGQKERHDLRGQVQALMNQLTALEMTQAEEQRLMREKLDAIQSAVGQNGRNSQDPTLRMLGDEVTE